MTEDIRRQAIRDLDRVIGQEIKRARQQSDMTLMDTAAVLGLTYQQVQKYEAGTNRISAGTLCYLLQLYRIPVAEFMARATKGRTKS